MLDVYEFDELCKKLNISDREKEVVNRIRNSPPSRIVGGGRYNVSGRYPSRKMGMTIQFESHRVELAAIYQMEYDDNVLEYYDQPPSIKLRYVNRNGRNIGVMSTPDFFVIRKDSIAWEEWKTEEELVKLSERFSNRIAKGCDGHWVCPPGQEYAKQFNLQYNLKSSTEIDWKFQRNIQFLEDYILDDKYKISQVAKKIIIDNIKENLGISLLELLEGADGYTSDDVYHLIAQNYIIVDLHQYCLSEPDTTEVFLSREHKELFYNMKASSKQVNFSPKVPLVEIGSKIIWNEIVWTIVNIISECISLLSENGTIVELPMKVFENFVIDKVIKVLNINEIESGDSNAKKIILNADENDLKTANYRFQFVQKKIYNEQIDYSQISSRTLRYWVKKYKDAEKTHGNGYLGLIPNNKKKGNKTRKLPEESIILMKEYIEEKYEAIKQKTKIVVYGELRNECEKKGILPPSYTTFCTCVNNQPKNEQIRKRQGERAAYNHESFYWELTSTTPKHGDRPFEICHIDHTELDIELVCSRTSKNLGRPWVTFLVDAFTRKILSFYLTFDSPSYRSNMMVLRECVKNYNRLPQTLVVDGGKDFHSVYFESLLANYHITKKTRPAAKSRFGSIIERLFGTTNKMFIHNLQGNTQIMKNVRQVTKSVNPKKHAIWTLEKLHETLEKWCYTVYDIKDHPYVGLSPRESFELGMQRSGARSFRLIPYDENFIVMTLPSTKLGKSKVQPGSGVKANYIYYWADIMKDPLVEGTVVPIRYDPFDIGIAYAYVKNKWIRCISQYYSIFQGRTEKELKLITQEIKKQKKNYYKKININAKKIAEFISFAEEQEEIFNQRNKDYEAKKTIKLVSSNQRRFDDIRPDGGLKGSSSINPHNLRGESLGDIKFDTYGEY